MDWVRHTRALGTSVVQLGAATHTKITKSETLLGQRRLMFGSEGGMYLTMDAHPFAIGTICEG